MPPWAELVQRARAEGALEPRRPREDVAFNVSDRSAEAAETRSASAMMPEWRRGPSSSRRVSA
jgi:hypothetical protein